MGEYKLISKKIKQKAETAREQKRAFRAIPQIISEIGATAKSIWRDKPAILLWLGKQVDEELGRTACRKADMKRK